MRTLGLSAPILALALFAPACEDDPPPAPPAPPPAARPAQPAAPRPGTAARTDGPPPLSLPNGEQAFVESGVVRDPFRNFSHEINPPPTTDNTEERLVILPNYGIDDLRLVAVVLGTDSPYAMVTDPSRRGTILRRGMYVGRREIVRNNETGQDYSVHWRVARVLPARLRRNPDGQLDEQPAELVFERADPSNRTSQLTERSIALGARPSETTATSTSALPSSVTIPGLGGAAPSYLPGALGTGGPVPPTPAGVRSAVGGGPQGAAPPTTTTTVVVQAPPAPPSSPVREIPPSSSPPPVRVTGDESPLNNR